MEKWVNSNRKFTGSVLILAVFLFVMTGLIYATQHRTNPEISNYVDALYLP